MTAAGRLRELREAWSAPRAPGEPASLPGLLTAAVDGLIHEALHGRNASGWGVVAVGGYGRTEMCLHSDIDVMLLGDVPADAVKQVLYPLWDSGMKVGHSVRTVREAMVAAGENVQTLSALLTTRLIAGDPEPLALLDRQLNGLLRRKRSVGETLAAEEREVRAREPFFIQEMDIKSGRGGLRSIHRDDWLRRRDEALGIGPPTVPIAKARQVLLMVRNALHATQGRGVERLAIETRSVVAAWLGLDPYEMCRRLYSAARFVDDRMLTRVPSGVETGSDPVARAGRLLVSAVRLRRTGAGAASATPLPAAVRDLGRSGASPGTAAFDPGADWAPADRSALVEMLAAGEEGWSAFRRLGPWGSDAFPELAAVTSMPQMAPFHRHPVDSHLWQTVSQVLSLTGGEDRWCSSLLDDLGSIDEVLLTAWLHDIGKGRDGDHSMLGAGLSRGILERLGFNRRTVDLVARGVELHLLLPTVSTRQDLDDRAVIEAAASRIGDPELLSLLAVIAMADARATGPTVWSEWTDTLLRTCVRRISRVLESGFRPPVAVTLDPALEAHVAAMPSGYLDRYGASMAQRHLELATPPPGNGEARIGVTGDDSIPTVVAVARDRPGLLALIAGVMSLNALDVLEARVATRADGVAIDTFRVQDTLGVRRLGGFEWDQARSDLETALSDPSWLESKLAAKSAAYSVPVAETRVDLEVDGGLLRVTVRAPDRMGLLHDLARELNESTAGVTTAKVTTRGHQAVDVFWVSPGPVPNEELVARLEQAIRRGA